MAKARTIETVSDLFNALGSLSEAAEFLDTSPQNAWNWKTAKRIPPQHYLAHAAKIKSRGLQVSEAIWFGSALSREKAGA